LADAQRRAQDAEAEAERLGTQADALRKELEGATARAAEADALRKELEGATARAAEADALRTELEDATARAAEADALRAELEGATARAAEAESAFAEPQQSEGPDPAALSELRAEVDRVTGELAIAIERRQTAEERLAAMTAELIAAQRAESAGPPRRSNGNGGGSDARNGAMPWSYADEEDQDAEDGNVPAMKAELHSVPPTESPRDDEPTDTASPIDEGADDIASLRSRLARTAAKKKSRSSMERPRSS
jgi:hypothetical protein